MNVYIHRAKDTPQYNEYCLQYVLCNLTSLASGSMPNSLVVLTENPLKYLSRALQEIQAINSKSIYSSKYSTSDLIN